MTTTTSTTRAPGHTTPPTPFTGRRARTGPGGTGAEVFRKGPGGTGAEVADGGRYVPGASGRAGGEVADGGRVPAHPDPPVPTGASANAGRPVSFQPSLTRRASGRGV